MPHRIASSMTAGHVLDVFGDGLDQSGIAYSLWDAEDRLVAYNDIYVRMFFTGFEHLVACVELSPREAVLMDQGIHSAHHLSKESKVQVRAQLSALGTRTDTELAGRPVLALPGATGRPAGFPLHRR